MTQSKFVTVSVRNWDNSAGKDRKSDRGLSTLTVVLHCLPELVSLFVWEGDHEMFPSCSVNIKYLKLITISTSLT